MNAKRAKQLRRVYRQVFGKDPHKGIRMLKDARYYEQNGPGPQTVHNVQVQGGLLIPIEHMDVVAPSEWRQLKRESRRPD